MPDLNTARAIDRPCELHEYHAPRPSRTNGHHRHPVYLQNRVYGHIQDSDLMWLCGTCHDNVHEWLSHLLDEAREPNPWPGRLARTEAQNSYDWYINALENKI